jgi:hypothetical protein
MRSEDGIYDNLEDALAVRAVVLRAAPIAKKKKRLLKQLKSALSVQGYL